MAVKIFCTLNDVTGYTQGETQPQDTFGLSISYKIFRSDEYTNMTGTYTMALPLTLTAPEVYGMLYAELISVCAANSYPTPAKHDVFAFIPMTLDQVLPDLPTFGD